MAPSVSVILGRKISLAMIIIFSVLNVAVTSSGSLIVTLTRLLAELILGRRPWVSKLYNCDQVIGRGDETDYETMSLPMTLYGYSPNLCKTKFE